MRKLEYIETSGGQYIDTGYIVKPNTSLVMRCNVQAQYQYPAPFGVRASSGNQAFCYFYRDNGASRAVISFGSGELRLSQPLAVYNNDIEITFTNSIFTIKNVTTDELLVNRQFTQMGALSQTLSLYLFTLNESGHDIGSICWTNMKLYSCEIYEDETLVKSYLPMLDDSMVPCLYESVNKETFYNAGSGSFTYEVASTVKYLVRDGNTIYTVTDGALVEVSGTLNAELFQTSGVDAMPDGTLLMTLSNPEVLCWTDAETLPTLTATVNGIPEPQTVMSKEIDLMHSSIKGINGVTVDCKGDVLFAVSFDKKATWMMHNGTEFVEVSDKLAGMTKTEFEAITAEQWKPKYEASSDMYIRCILFDETQSITAVNVDFIN